jgi:DNA repair exonuclease SbcCD ATPase subunit
MQFTIASVIVKDFRTLKNASINFEKLGNGLHRLTGINKVQPRLSTNDVSKSSLWDAITWCLYGRTSRNLNTNDIKPWKGGNNPHVKVMVIQDGRKHTVEKTARTRLWDGNSIDQATLDKNLRMGFNTFNYSIVLPQFQLMFFDLPPSKKLELFTEILELDRWDTRSKKAKDRANNLDEKAREYADELIAVNAEITQYNNLVVSTRNELKKWEDERNSQLEEADKQLVKYKEDLNTTQSKYEKAQLASDSAWTELKPLDKEIDELNNKINKIEIAYQTEMAANAKEITRLKREIDDINDNGNCPTCGQTLEGTNLGKHISKLKKEINKYKQGKDWTKEKEATDNLKVKLNNLLETKEKFEEKANNADSRVAILAPQFGALQQKVIQLQEILSEKREIRNPHSDTLSNLRSYKSILSRKKEELDKRYNILNRKIIRTRHWIKGFKDIRLQIVQEVLHELELTTNIMLSEVGLDGWEIKYSIEQETKAGTVQRKLNVMILSPENDKLVKWECWGGGVSQRLRLVGALAFGETLLSHAGIQSKFLVADEPSRHMSPEGIEDMVELLARLAKDKQIFLTDHTLIESGKFKSTIVITKTKEGSYVN